MTIDRHLCHQNMPRYRSRRPAHLIWASTRCLQKTRTLPQVPMVRCITASSLETKEDLSLTRILVSFVWLMVQPLIMIRTQDITWLWVYIFGVSYVWLLFSIAYIFIYIIYYFIIVKILRIVSLELYWLGGNISKYIQFNSI